MFPLTPVPVANHTDPPTPDLLHLINNTHQVFQGVNSDLGKDCWFYVPHSVLSYHDLGLTQNNSTTIDSDCLLQPYPMMYGKYFLSSSSHQRWKCLCWLYRCINCHFGFFSSPVRDFLYLLWWQASSVWLHQNESLCTYFYGIWALCLSRQQGPICVPLGSSSRSIHTLTYFLSKHFEAINHQQFLQVISLYQLLNTEEIGELREKILLHNLSGGTIRAQI